jgi:nucleotide-binding universal stress UspA family protein
MFKHILVPTDGSLLSQDTVARAASFAREAGARVTLFYACPEPLAAYEGLGAISSSHLSPELHARLNEAALEILDDAEKTMHEAEVPCQRVVLAGNKPALLIIQTAEANGCDLIFMASHGRRGVSALLLGSETQKVLTHSKIPVLVYR